MIDNELTFMLALLLNDLPVDILTCCEPIVYDAWHAVSPFQPVVQLYLSVCHSKHIHYASESRHRHGAM